MGSRITVVGIGADGWSSMSATGREHVLAADVLLGGERHLAMIPPTDAAREQWPSPLLSSLDDLLARHPGRVVALASGDPLVSGIGSTLIRRLGRDAVEVIPAVSSVALARARMGWSAEECDTVTLVGRDVDALRRYLSRGRRLIVLTSNSSSLPEIARLLVGEGFADAAVTVLGNLGADEDRIASTAGDLVDTAGPQLGLLCIECVGAEGLSTTPGLPDEFFENDGQLSKRPIRAAAVCALAPRPGELLWDVGAGAGSVGIEWARTDPRCRAIAIEKDRMRGDAIARNAARLGVPSLRVVTGGAPDALAGLDVPDAIFVGGGGSRDGVLEACWHALRPGGRLVVHAVTLETEAVLVQWWKKCGGELSRLSVEQASSIGTFTGWQSLRPVVQWSVTKGEK
ncbi:precorrin-6y C5,15-methyltransferase (decarboxylating) subunit CbiE [Rhodococcus artemisiae]|uniref:Precorrin-6y C5,15-methyltransferase (Decarboxylating) subunit CbiE n=1 Tax=Rhodococcus artemisiae TaxID=714159 RepID=A0ABU7LHG7_9NOCA|nr:precorrin-6y C5,15-methyltransferase (decarboxylating) subunit CbiE [Rhodococcus artemisiae]MEE2061010.1 precorrin-6y C5,15-methyltransferase (decarboxylating) subunit CbiE [Rhodococcus artemisiae]